VSGRIPALEAARGVAALMVVAVHVQSFHAMDGVPQAGWLAFTTRGFLGVQVFFVLSGLVLYLPYARGKPLEPGRYAIARLARIVPALWVAMACAWLLTGIWSPLATRHLLFLNPDGWVGYSPDPPAWSLTIEMGFYVLLPALVYVFVKAPWARVPVLAGLIGLGLLMRWGYGHGWPRSPLTFVDNFAAGMLAAMLVARLRLPAWTLIVGALAFAAGIGLPGVGENDALSLAMVGVLFAVALTVLAAVAPTTPRGLVWLGTVSYGIYLWHWPILEVATEHGLFRLPDLLEIALVGALATIAGWASWRFVERPVLEIARGRRGHRLSKPDSDRIENLVG
jgi:peptidoglycan/LPS O-acetylase OafA/YrhL